MQYIEQLERAAETPGERRNGRVLAIIDAHAESGTTANFLPHKDVSVRERLQQITAHCFDPDGHGFPFRKVCIGWPAHPGRGGLRLACTFVTLASARSDLN
jgi:hypothetical protein